MNTTESESKMNWTVNIVATTDQTETVQQLLDKFVRQVQVTGARCNTVQVAPLKLEKMEGNQMEGALQMLRQHGMGDEQIERQRQIMMAHMGQGSWADVVRTTERELAVHRAQGDVPQELGAVYKLVEYAMNAGDKEKAVAYFRQAEQLLATTPLADLLGKASAQMAPELQAQTRQRYQSELERLRNWLF
jgi:hypothetical protein